jgi:hypothetical protein
MEAAECTPQEFDCMVSRWVKIAASLAQTPFPTEPPVDNSVMAKLHKARNLVETYSAREAETEEEEELIRTAKAHIADFSNTQQRQRDQWLEAVHEHGKVCLGPVVCFYNRSLGVSYSAVQCIVDAVNKVQDSTPLQCTQNTQFL